MFNISDSYRNISNNRGKCLFDSVLKLKKVKGQVTDNGITALYSKSEVGVGNLIVGGVSLQNRTDWRAAELIGRMVEGYYNEEDELLYVKLLSNEKILHIDALEIEDFSNNTLNPSKVPNTVPPPKSSHFASVALRTYDFVSNAPEKVTS